MGAIIAKGEKLESMPKAPAFLGEKLREMKALWENTTTTAKKRLDDLRNNAGNWNTFAEKCQTLQTQVTTAQKQIDDVKKVENVFLCSFALLSKKFYPAVRHEP